MTWLASFTRSRAVRATTRAAAAGAMTSVRLDAEPHRFNSRLPNQEQSCTYLSTVERAMAAESLPVVLRCVVVFRLSVCVLCTKGAVNRSVDCQALGGHAFSQVSRAR